MEASEDLSTGLHVHGVRCFGNKSSRDPLLENLGRPKPLIPCSRKLWDDVTFSNDIFFDCDRCVGIFLGTRYGQQLLNLPLVHVFPRLKSCCGLRGPSPGLNSAAKCFAWLPPPVAPQTGPGRVRFKHQHIVIAPEIPYKIFACRWGAIRPAKSLAEFALNPKVRPIYQLTWGKKFVFRCR